MRFFPDKFLSKALPRAFFKQNVITNDLTLNKTVKRAILSKEFVDTRTKDLNSTSKKVIDSYRAKIKEGITKKSLIENQDLIRNRIKNLLVYDEVQVLKKEHKGEYYRWLPSGAENPDPQHQLLYGKIFKVGEGDSNGNMPGERYGCQCGMEFLTKKEVANG